MNVIQAYYILNMKILLKEKLPLLWSTALPVIFLFINGQYVQDTMFLNYFWAIIIFACYIFGVGLQAVRLREAGLLKTYFSMNPSRMLFFISLVLTQMTSAFISMVILNSIAALFFPVSFVEAMLYSTLLIFLALPVAFLSANLTMLHKSSYQTLSTVIAIIFFISLFTLTFEHMINYVNPLVYLSQILFMQGAFEYLVYVIGSALCIITGVYSLRNYRVNSIMRR
ncbi:hypothetical protein [Geomicrobium sediminis]|uniref:ABC-2 type transport system permease protein n=1 Tax=Geomicrobium sediminis TaxID=1347788 RepID=A0ABS2PCL6_9BACL|nr:hypothetical protein [Geomicrobium sediminis]MBM7633168.1 ABC-2 type transport system permease protein [Geomicrobium sediminis]